METTEQQMMIYRIDGIVRQLKAFRKDPEADEIEPGLMREIEHLKNELAEW